ncbi:hypothetical protein [Nostoc sp. PCC 7107]|uniref:hypothetical protein n=1 Tax=Nostoc sp. PCC 7107 TaxID=317936 RepID=UPI00029F0730|nr:hypothetical protein [Nostoc sp. PCC 7107]AFY43669.1 hypothetical protein Nos7107_3078 [Nostoc sp. PCC 7107]
MPLSNPEGTHQTLLLIATKTSNQSLTSNAAATPIIYNTKDYDPYNGYVSSGTGQGIYTVPAWFSGIVELTCAASVSFSGGGSSGTETIVLSAYKNGTFIGELDRALATAIAGASDGAGNSIYIPSVSPGDTVEARIQTLYTAATGTITIVGSAKNQLSLVGWST